MALLLRLEAVDNKDGMAHSHHHVLARNARNPLRQDPTRTTTIQRRFALALRARFAKVRRHIIEFLVELDALGLKEKSTLVPFRKLVGNVQPREFQFLTDAAKLKAFNDWLRQQIEADILSVDPGTDPTRPWTSTYIESSYKRGLMNAFAASKQGQLFDEDAANAKTQEAFLRSAFNQPETLSKVQLLSTRSFEQLKGITSTMSSNMNRILAQGIADGRGPADIAREMSDNIDGLSRGRAMVLARTELINAHAEGQLDTFEELGVEELGVKAEWSTAGDDRVCPQCAPMEGKVFSMQEARGMIPLHPQCRCSWIPAIE